MKIKQELENAVRVLKQNSIEDANLKARILLANILHQNKEYLIIHNEKELDEESIHIFKQGIDNLCNGIPLQYITNKQEFMGLKFYVNENVLIPQPDTEILVEEVIDICKKYSCNRDINILDLCTGIGAIGIAIAKNIENCQITLSDISSKALEVAKKNCINILETNLESNDNNIKIIQSDLFENIDKNSKFDIIVSNPPYIQTDVIETLSEDVKHEPIIALDGGQDGLSVYKRIINEAYNFLKPNGYLCLEIGYNQKEEVIKLLEITKKYKDIYSKKDLAGNDRIIMCKNKEN